MIAAASARRHDLDWLRVIAFGFLIFYHIGMFYVTWDWHVKSPHMGPELEPLMALVNPWRLPLLFLISGAALHFAIDRAHKGRFVAARMRRLGLPILFGMVVVCMPQAYFELLSKGEIEPGVLAFYPRYLNLESGFSIITPTYNHLWYLVYALLYTLMIVAILQGLRTAQGLADSAIGWLSNGRLGWRMLVVPALPFLIYGALLAPHFPVTMMVIDDWANHANLFTFVIIGWFIAKSEVFWSGLEKHLRPILVAMGVLGVLVLLCRLNWSGVRTNDTAFTAYLVVRTFYMWAMVLALLGLAHRYLRTGNRLLAFLNDRVFAYYILHQTLIIAYGCWLGGMALPVWIEASLLVSATLFGCVVLTEAIGQVPLLRPLLGLKPRARPAPKPLLA